MISNKNDNVEDTRFYNTCLSFQFLTMPKDEQILRVGDWKKYLKDIPQEHGAFFGKMLQLADSLKSMNREV